MSETVDARTEVEICLFALAADARRCQQLVHRLKDDPLTEWDERHAKIDALLDRIIPPE